ncbi:MAG: hypothetical protein MJ118_05690 [Clostridia bacterium]|nr:hypothetical protein [Clostridia bacterium]
MVAFLKNRRNALIITAVMIVLSLVLSWAISTVRVEYEPYAAGAASRYANKNYKQYRQFVEDKASILGSDGAKAAAKYIAQTEYSFGRKIGVKTVSRLDGEEMQSAALQALQKAPFSQCDGLLLIDAQTGSWYAVFSNDFERYAEQGLQGLFEKMLGSTIERKRAGRTVAELLRELTQWMTEHHPRVQQSGLEGVVEGILGRLQMVFKRMKPLLRPALIVLVVVLVFKDALGGKRK